MNHTIVLTVLTGILYFCAIIPGRAQTANWPQFRGVNCSGIAADNARPPLELNDQNLLWKTELPAGHSSPSIWGNNVFLTGCVEDENKLEMYCIDRGTGAIKWKDSLLVEEFEQVHAIGNAAQSSPVTDGERVYFYFGSYGLLCYDVSGTFLWEKKFPVANCLYGVASSPVVYGDKLILCRDVGIEAKLYALNKMTGDSIWINVLPERQGRFATQASFSTPVIWQDDIVMHRCLQASANSLEDGSPVWWISLPTNGNSTPVFSGDLIYFGAWREFSEVEQRGELPVFEDMISRYDSDQDGYISKEEIPDEMILFDRPEVSEDVQPPLYLKQYYKIFDHSGDGLSDNTEWNGAVAFFRGFFTEGGLIALRPGGTGTLLPESIAWKVSQKVPEVPSPIYYNDLVYMCKNGGLLTCMDARDGTVYYQERIGAAGAYIASPVAANGYIYLTSLNGVVTVIKAGKELAVVQQSYLHERDYATPAIIGNVIYFRTASSLVAYGN